MAVRTRCRPLKPSDAEELLWVALSLLHETHALGDLRTRVWDAVRPKPAVRHCGVYRRQFRPTWRPVFTQVSIHDYKHTPHRESAAYPRDLGCRNISLVSMARCQDPRHEPIAVRNRGGWFGGQAIDAGTTTSRTGVGFNCFPVYLRSIIVDQPQGYAVCPYRGNGDIGACHWGARMNLSMAGQAD
jgi:hypothetical protein